MPVGVDAGTALDELEEMWDDDPDTYRVVIDRRYSRVRARIWYTAYGPKPLQLIWTSHFRSPTDARAEAEDVIEDCQQRHSGGAKAAVTWIVRA